MKDAGKLLTHYTLLPKRESHELLASALGTFEDELIAAGLRGLYRLEAYLQLLLCSTNFPALPAEDGRGAGKISIQRPKSEHLHEEEIV